MAEATTIEWCDSTFNPWIGCTRVSPGCDDCYAARSTPVRTKRIAWGPGAPRHRTGAYNWGRVSDWQEAAPAFFDRHQRRRRVFCASLADWLDNEVSISWLADLLELIDDTPDLDWLLLTKRIGNWKNRLLDVQRFVDEIKHPQPFPFGLRGLVTRWLDGEPPANVWLGATVIDQAEADRDIPKLLAVPARVRFLSIEPMLGPIQLGGWLWTCCGNMQCGSEADGQPDSACCGRPERADHLDWVIAGGESGPKARPAHPDWFRSLRDQCDAAGVPFHFKQWGEFLPATANEDDPTVADVPDSRLFWSDGAKWDRFDGQRGGVDLVARVGKADAGRLLDGVEHNAFPEQ